MANLVAKPLNRSSTGKEVLSLVSCQVTKQRMRRWRCFLRAALVQLHLQEKHPFCAKIEPASVYRIQVNIKTNKCWWILTWSSDIQKQIAQQTYVVNCSAIYHMFNVQRQYYYANYLTGAWISSFNSCLSPGRIFILILRSSKLDLYTGKYGTIHFTF